ncbi:hypothetical protein VP1G_11385 [Cytospora mali]|uniref:Uncharacterized protein n=1 Tax=Cytospora mali TaxID=578113 RepID=A0A194VFW5_CYTMA|nr:hypothetical protein VP1G_11385 [Valsa mali var. pyri (nom. inval.)]
MIPLPILLMRARLSDVRIARQRLRNLPARLNLSDLDQTIARLRDSLGDGVGTLGLSLGPDDVGLSLLLGLLDDEACPLGVLLRNLLLLDGLGELLAEGHVGDGHVLERDVELGRALQQVRPDALGHGLTLGDELGGILGRACTSGLCNTLNVKLTICKSLEPVVVEIMRGFVRTSKIILLCNQGIRKCVPSLMTPSFTPDSRSKITARVPPRTSYMD